MQSHFKTTASASGASVRLRGIERDHGGHLLVRGGLLPGAGNPTVLLLEATCSHSRLLLLRLVGLHQVRILQVEHDAVVLEQAALAMLLLLLVNEGSSFWSVLFVHSVVIKWYHGQGCLRLVDLFILNRSKWIISMNDTLEVLVEFLLP